MLWQRLLLHLITGRAAPTTQSDSIWSAEAELVQQAIETTRREQKRLVAAITDKSGTPEAVSPEMLRAVLTLSDTRDG